MQSPPFKPAPGLAKIRNVPFVQRRSVVLCSAQEGRWREVLDAADVVSEGRTQPEGQGLVYYGSTSVLLPRCSAGGVLPDLDIDTFTTVLRLDPHVRTRALRIAHREALARAGGPIGTLYAEIGVDAGARGVTLLVEVVARLSSHHLRATGGGR